MDLKKFKTLDPNRPNTLPRYLPNVDVSSSQDAGDALTSKYTPEAKSRASTVRLHTAEELFSRTTGSIPTKTGVVPNQEDLNKSRETLFQLDVGPKFDTFALPGKPDTSTIFRSNEKERQQANVAARKRQLVAKKQPASSSAAATGTSDNTAQATSTGGVDFGNEETENEFAFLASSIGMGNGNDNENGDKKGKNEKSGAGAGHGGTNSDLDRISSIMNGIKTGDDAINFFARYGSDTPVKFVDMTQVVDTKTYRPYDLVAVNLRDPKMEHYTISSSGIVHVCPGEPSECVSLSNWMRQGMMFRILRNIPFYRYFLHRKMYNAWKENVRFQLYLKQRKKVSDRLFLTRKSSCGAILAIKRYLMQIQHVKLLQLDIRGACEKDAFVEQQTQQFARAATQFEESMHKVIIETMQVQAEVTNQHGLALQDPGANTLSYSDTASPEKAKSLVKMKQEKAERKFIRQRAKLEYSTLHEFIRYVDYLSVETLAVLAISTANSFCDEFTRNAAGKNTRSFFETTVQFNEAGTNFSPTCDEFRDMLMLLFDTMINTVGSVNRPVFLLSKGPTLITANIQSIIRENKQYRSTLHRIEQRVVMDFDIARNYVEDPKGPFQGVRPMYEDCMTWDFEAYKEGKFDNDTKPGIASFKSKLELIYGWNKKLEMLRNKELGVLLVDSKHLKNKLVPLRESRLEEIKRYIQEEARTQCLHLLDKYKDCLQKLAQRPVHLKEFASLVETIAKMKAEEKIHVFKATSQVNHMYKLLTQYEVNIPSEDAVLHDEVQENEKKYRTEIEAAQNFKDSKLEEFVGMVGSNMTRMQKEVGTIVSRFDEPLFVGVESFEDANRVVDELTQLSTRLDKEDSNFRTLSGYQKMFQVDAMDSAELETAKERIENLKQLWATVKLWNEKHSYWLESQFTLLNVEDVEKEVQQFSKDSYNIHKKVGTKISEMLRDKVQDFKAIVPDILDLGNPNMQFRHFDKVFKLVSLNYYQDMPFSLALLLKSNIMNYRDQVQEISACASGEAQLEASLAKIKAGWEKMKFTVLNHRDQHGLFILGSLEEINTLLEDNQVTLQTMLGSRYIRGIQDRVEEWEKKLAILSETLDEWITCQKTWMYLENIFGAEDIQKQLPAESQKFLVVDRSWKQIMTRTHGDPLVTNALIPLDNGLSLLDCFQMNNVALDSIQKSLEEYLETKRGAFPRFYFLSNDELLEILSQTRDPQAVQPHMSKCFDAIKRIKFGEGRNQKDILGFVDPGNEYVGLDAAVKAEGPVEHWLLNFESGMRHTLYELCKEAFTQYPPTEEGSINRRDWLWKYPAQVVIAIDQVIWTANCGGALFRMKGSDEVTADPNATEKFLSYSLRQIDAMVALVRMQLSVQQRTLICAILTIDVHARDVTRAIVTKKIDSLTDFEWTKQLRYYWDEEEDDVFAKQTNSSFRYGYEYLGNGPRLVITPLTDTCYMTLTGALHMRLGGAPAGPAGTGKTETTKDLAKALAVYCVVFNCSDGLDYKIMGRFFSGLAQQGAWACFDEFNRIDIEVLSVIAQLVLCIQQAVIKRQKEFDFQGQIIPLNFSFGVFITMNPGYAGRTELPDNLKSLFRPVAMMVPDYRLIAEIMLFSEGFANALPLSNKMSQLYALSSEQLSKQSHYDFGMRAVKSVLVAAGQLKRKEPETNEGILLIRAMRDSNVPKFLEQDLPLFGGIISDLFPGIKVPYVDYGKLQLAIERTIENKNLQKVPIFITKVIQVHETQLVRHGMMVVGESGSGKSTNVLVLAEALGLLYDEKVVDRDGFYKGVDRLILNPKSITAGELYGETNAMTNEWKDGIVPKLVRECVTKLNEGSDRRKWVIFDGPVDAVWIENMNTVLDDNKTLCLANSERIKLPHTLHMLFEVQDLRVASPATVSRCGMVFMEQVHVGTLSLVRTWSNTTLKNLVGVKVCKAMASTIEAHLDAAIDFIRNECKEKVATSNNQLAASLINLITAKLLAEPDPMTISQDVDLMNALLVWCFAWSVGSNIVDSSRKQFRDWCEKRFASLLTPKFAAQLHDLYGCYIDMVARDAKPWTSLMPQFTYNAAQPYFSILVPTIDTTRYRYLLDKLMNADNNVLFMAETGVGKSVVINAFLNEMTTKGKTVSYVVGYSAQTKPANLRDVLETKLEKKRQKLLGPPSGKKMFLFVDDLNMPALEKYGAQPPNELLRQMIDQGGFYDVNKLFFKNVENVVVVAACAPPGGGRNEVSPRLLRHFHMVWLTNLSEASMCRIFRNILQGFLEASLPGMVPMAESLVQSSVDIYLRIQKELLPTPLRSHYTFNLRDLSKVFQGVLMVRPKFFTDNNSLIRLWCHEGARVFRDRLINDEDREWYNQAVLHQLHTSLNSPTWQISDFSDVLYGDFIQRQPKEYQELSDPKKVLAVLMDYLSDYNMNFSTRMELVFFKDAINHVARIARVLSQPRGNALLVGVGGSGRQSLTRMAAWMANYKCRQIEITRGYGMNEWHDNLKDILMNAGAKNQPTVFLFSDTQIVTETFLEDINNILNSGEVPNLFETDELERIVGAVRPLAKAAGKIETRESILQHFVYLVRENLHIVLCMSPIGAGFRTRCRMFPSLVNCCTIDWFNAWPEDALFSVAQKMFDGQRDIGIGEYVDSLSNMCNNMHRTVEKETVLYFNELKRYNYTTPTSYLELIKLYVDILKKQQAKISSNERRYRIGLDKLRETEEIVAKLEQSLTEMQPVLAKAAEDTQVLLIQVTEDQKEADAKAAVVEVDVQEANKVAASVKVINDDCQADLDEAMPAYESAVRALDTLDKKMIQEMKAFNNPPEMVKFTMEAVCILFDSKPDWGEAKRLLGQMDFMDQLRRYDKDNINPKLIKKVLKYYQDARFVPDKVESQSAAAKCLCMWVRAMVDYDRVAKSIEPKKAALKEAQDQLAQTMKELGAKKAALQEVRDRVAALRRTLKDTEDKKALLEAQADRAKKQLVRAGQLIGGLGGEKVRWQASAVALGDSLINLVGDMCLAAGCLAYLGPFTSQFRSRIVGQWVTLCKQQNIPCGDFTLLKALAEPVVLRAWQIDGLPADDFSCENGLLTTMGRRWPLMIDPQGQANRWIRNTYASKNLQIIKLTEKDFLRTLENGIRYGAPVLLENVLQELDPSLEPVLLKQVFKRAGQVLLRLGDTDVPYSDEFKFFITTKLANPHYMPEICIKVTVINFTVTMKGLEDQLLVDVIKNERPDLEERKDKLVVSIANDQRQLLEIEEQILSMLANASGNILDDEELINALARSKTTSTAINTRLMEAENTTKEINATREGYRVVATRGSVIYFVVANLALVDPMYQYSLQYYKELVSQRLQKTEKKEQLQDRLNLLVDDITTSIYTNVCRGLFEKDKLLFSFMISAKIAMAAKVVGETEWVMFMVGAVVKRDIVDKYPMPANVAAAEISERQWQNILMLDNDLMVFTGLREDVEKRPKDWGAYLACDTPHIDALPGYWEAKVNGFQRLLLVRVLREEKVVFAIRRYVEGCIGSYFTESPPFDLEGAYNDSTSVSPLIFILSPGADPTDYLLQLADSKNKGGSGLRIISLGQGQGPIAEKAIDIAQKTGDWVCLQNCHLAVSWLAKLEQVCEKMLNEPDSVDKGFRLWLTSMPSQFFPVPVLQNGIKVTNEPPRGLRANLMRTFNDMTPEEYESCSKPLVFKKMFFATAFFNALILERRKFGAVGWNISYDWMNSDLKAASTQVRMYIEEQFHVPWETLNVSVADITYGGRVTDAWDKRAISSILRKYFTPQLLEATYLFTDDGVYYAPDPHGNLQVLTHRLQHYFFVISYACICWFHRVYESTFAACLLSMHRTCSVCTRMPRSLSSRRSPAA
jgi:dynein heavy chain